MISGAFMSSLYLPVISLYSKSHRKLCGLRLRFVLNAGKTIWAKGRASYLVLRVEVMRLTEQQVTPEGSVKMTDPYRRHQKMKLTTAESSLTVYKSTNLKKKCSDQSL